MKTKKVIVGAVSAAILSLNVCAIPAAFAAGETVQISVGNATATAGSTFSVEVEMSAIPSTGIQACDFAIEYDSSVLTITKVTAGALTDTGASSADSTASIVPVFDSEIGEGVVNVAWSTLLDDSKYWLQNSGTFCTIEGKVAEGAKDGTYKLTVTGVDRETYPGSGVNNSGAYAGYTSGTDSVSYTVKTTDGSVKVGSAVTGTLKGDANVDGKVDITDVVVIMSAAADPVKNALSEVGAINADVYEPGKGINTSDATMVQQYIVKLIAEW